MWPGTLGRRCIPSAPRNRRHAWETDSASRPRGRGTALRLHGLGLRRTPVRLDSLSVWWQGTGDGDRPPSCASFARIAGDGRAYAPRCSLVTIRSFSMTCHLASGGAQGTAHDSRISPLFRASRAAGVCSTGHAPSAPGQAAASDGSSWWRRELPPTPPAAACGSGCFRGARLVSLRGSRSPAKGRAPGSMWSAGGWRSTCGPAQRPRQNPACSCVPSPKHTCGNAASTVECPVARRSNQPPKHPQTRCTESPARSAYPRPWPAALRKTTRRTATMACGRHSCAEPGCASTATGAPRDTTLGAHMPRRRSSPRHESPVARPPDVWCAKAIRRGAWPTWATVGPSLAWSHCCDGYRHASPAQRHSTSTFSRFSRASESSTPPHGSPGPRRATCRPIPQRLPGGTQARQPAPALRLHGHLDGEACPAAGRGQRRSQFWWSLGSRGGWGRQAGHGARPTCPPRRRLPPSEQRLGFESHAYDLCIDPRMDLLAPFGFLYALHLVLRLKPGGLLHLAPPCSTFVWINRGTSCRLVAHRCGSHADLKVDWHGRSHGRVECHKTRRPLGKALGGQAVRLGVAAETSGRASRRPPPDVSPPSVASGGWRSPRLGLRRTLPGTRAARPSSKRTASSCACACCCRSRPRSRGVRASPGMHGGWRGPSSDPSLSPCVRLCACCRLRVVGGCAPSSLCSRACLSLYLYVSLSVSLPLCLSVGLSVCLPACLPTLPASLSACLSVCLSVSRSVSPTFCQ